MSLLHAHLSTKFRIQSCSIRMSISITELVALRKKTQVVPTMGQSAAGDLPASNQMDDSTQLFQTFNSAAKVHRTDSVSAKWLAIGSVDTNLLEIGNFQDPADAREQPAPQDVGQGPISQSHESIPPPQQHLSTLERLDPTVSHGQMVQNYLNAQIILQEIAVGNLLGPRRPLTDGLFKHRSKDRCGKLRIMAMDQDFDPYSFGRWFCQRVAWHMGTDGHPFKLAGRIWLALIFLELRLSVQAELLRISGTTRVEFDSDLTVPWAIIEHDSPYLRARHDMCTDLWNKAKNTVQ